MDDKSIQHTRWNCTYHIVFIPKYRRKIMYGELKKDISEILSKLCKMKQVEIIEGMVNASWFLRHTAPGARSGILGKGGTIPFFHV